MKVLLWCQCGSSSRSLSLSSVCLSWTHTNAHFHTNPPLTHASLALTSIMGGSLWSVSGCHELITGAGDGRLIALLRVCWLSAERYRIQSESFEDMWLVAKELVQRFDRHFASLGVKDFRNSFTGPVPLLEYFETVDHHFEVPCFPHCHKTDSWLPP